MTKFNFLVLLFPVVFMVHDFEEIIFSKIWFRKNGRVLMERFPRLPKAISTMQSHSTAAFSLGVAEEFILISLVSFGAVYMGNYYIWLAFFMGFSLHLVVHIVQWVIFRRYIPVIVTTFLSLPYVVYVLLFILKEQLFTIGEIVAWGTGGFIIVAINLLLVHKLITLFDRYVSVK